MTPSPNEPRIYLLPNLMTAGNLFCGFAATLRIIGASLLAAKGEPTGMLYHEAIAFILGACVFDLLDGRLARLGGHESPFGREFDSLADIVSFGIAPALLVYQIVLRDFQRTGWLIAFLFLLCGALRLARFNVGNKAAPVGQEAPERTTFIGVPSPAGAMLVLVPMYFAFATEGVVAVPNGVIALWMVGMGVLMISRIRTPSLKRVTVYAEYAKYILVGGAAVVAALLTYPWVTLLGLAVAYLVAILFLWRRERAQRKAG